MRPGAAALTSGSIPRTLIAFSLPILMGNVLQTINGSINAVWVGKFLGETALAATANANIVMFLLLGVVFGITMAATVAIAQSVGANRMLEAKRIVGSSATFFAAFSMAMSAVGFVFCEAILRLMQTPPDVMPLAAAYMRVMFVALPLSYAFFFVMAVLRGAGDSKTPFYFLVMSVALDIALNPLLIFGLGPLPGFGIAGSALATLIAQAASLAAMMRHIYRKRSPLALHRGEAGLLRIDLGILRMLVLKGVPMGLQMIVLSSSMVAMMSLVNRFGSDTTAAFAAALQLWSYVQMPAFALSAAVSSIAAQNIGAGLWNRVSATTRFAVLLNVALTGVPVVMILIFNRYALGLFLPATGAAIEIAHHLNLIVLWSFPFFGISMVLSGVVRAAGAVVAPLLLLFVSLWVIRLPLAFATIDRLQADALWWSFSISSVLSSLMTMAYYLHGSWRSARLHDRGGPPGAQPAT
jgi:putative MATE family efflux protein